ncbi:MAG TPA: hypothetical protein VNZ61_10340 [Roseomonas sp.]|nr:hypothetical protein [Roseomonas sp.]
MTEEGLLTKTDLAELLRLEAMTRPTRARVPHKLREQIEV